MYIILSVPRRRQHNAKAYICCNKSMLTQVFSQSFFMDRHSPLNMPLMRHCDVIIYSLHVYVELIMQMQIMYAFRPIGDISARVHERFSIYIVTIEKPQPNRRMYAYRAYIGISYESITWFLSCKRAIILLIMIIKVNEDISFHTIYRPKVACTRLGCEPRAEHISIYMPCIHSEFMGEFRR